MVYFYFSLSILLAPWRRINFDIEVCNVWAIWLEGSGGMWGLMFFLGFGREVGQEVNVIVWKCMGGGVEIVNFFSIDCERSTVHIYISARGFCVEKTVFKNFLGVLFCTSSKGILFAFFFIGYHETTGYSSLDFFLSSSLHLFSSIFSSSFKRHFLPPFFVLPSFFGILIFRPFSYSSSYQMFLIVFFCRISWFYLFIHFYLFV